MSLILAVEPDRRRAAQLSAMARAYLDAELIVAPSVTQAFTALGERVPDVMLTGPLLPATEESALTDYLRLIGPAGTHVPLLTIPLLAAPARATEPHLLSAFRRNRSKPQEHDGCDPATFAQQIAAYLDEAAGRRRTAAAVPVPTPAPATAVPSWDAAAPALVADPEPAPFDTIEPELTEFLIEAEPEVAPEPTPEPTPYVERGLVPTSSALVPIVLPEVDDEIDLSDALDDELPELAFYEPAPMFEPPVAAAPPPMLVPIAPPVQAPPPAANVQQIITIPTGTGTQVQAAVNVAVAVSVQVAATVNVQAPPRRPGKPKPIQDEWGFFDPTQCGFPALMAKLDEIAAKDDAD